MCPTTSTKTSPTTPVASSNASITEQLAEQRQLLLDMQKEVTTVKRWLFWARIWGVLKVLIIVIPLIWAVIYLPELIQQYTDPYLNFFQQQPGSADQDSLRQLLQQLQ